MNVRTDNTGHSRIAVLSEDGRRILWEAKYLTTRADRDLRRDDWLPPADLLPGTEAVRDNLATLRARLDDADRNLAELRDRYRREDDARILTAASGEPDDRTPHDERERTAREASEHADSARLAWWQAADDALAWARRHVPEWEGLRAERRNAAANRIAEAQRMTREAEAEAARANALGHWIVRNATDLPEALMSGDWGTVAAFTGPPPPIVADLATLDAGLDPEPIEA